MKKPLITMLAATTLGMAGMMTSAAVQADVGPNYQGNYGYVCTNSRSGNLNMRKGPGTNYGKRTYIPNGGRVTIVDNAEGNKGFTWYKVRYNGYIGWVRYDYVCD